MNVKLTAEQKKTVIDASDSIAAVMQQILKRENKLGRAQEHFWIAGLDTHHKLLFVELLGLGRQNRVHANPPDVFRMAIYKLAIDVILVHNHPSGKLVPSMADLSITDRLLKSGRLLNINVIDHIIISETNHISLEDTGDMEKLRSIDTWQILDRTNLENKINEQEIERREIQRKNSIEIAEKMKKKGMDLKTIKQLTGVSLIVLKTL